MNLHEKSTEHCQVLGDRVCDSLKTPSLHLHFNKNHLFFNTTLLGYRQQQQQQPTSFTDLPPTDSSILVHKYAKNFYKTFILIMPNVPYNPR